MTPSTSANAMWGGRFSDGPAQTLRHINASIRFDQRLALEDIAGSLAHASMLARQGIISADDGARIIWGLEQIRGEITEERFTFREDLEDIHMNVEARLFELIGEPARRLHTARSRNDQVATDLRLWARGQCGEVDAALRLLHTALLDKAEAHAATVMPGFTHLQSAQPVTFGHHLMAYVEMLGRDRGRFRDCRERLNECPLGSAALAGTSFPIDRHGVASELGFRAPCVNSLDAVASRDFVLEFLAAAAICATHLSRLAEEIILWATPQFGFIRLSDAYTTGSSIMPQKRNPDAAELVRGKAGRVIGALAGLLATIKGLPLAYNKDLQEDKEPAFDATDTLLACLTVTAGMVEDLTPDAARMADAAAWGYSTATDLADWLTRELRLPFRDAHHVTGRIVRLAEERGVALADLPLSDMQGIEPRIREDVRDVLTTAASVASRASYGGTAPARVAEAVREARRQYLKEASWPPMPSPF